MRADLVIRGGRIFTAEPSVPFATAVAVEGKRCGGTEIRPRADRPPHRASVDGGYQGSPIFGQTRGRRRRRELHRLDIGVSASDNTVLESGMVLTPEPGVQMGPGRRMVHQEDIVMTDDGAELIGRRAASELPVIVG